jgi:hypothetical protein
VRLLLDRAITLGRSDDAQVAKCAERYRDYAILLISVYEAFLAKGRGFG